MDNTILVSYDLIAPGKDYSKLYSHLRSCKNWARPLESVWILKTSNTAEQVRNDAIAYIDQNDKLLALDVTGRAAAWFGLSTNIGEWIKANL